MYTIIYNKSSLYIKQIPTVFCTCGLLNSEMSRLLGSSSI